jgi:hypothetical protein
VPLSAANALTPKEKKHALIETSGYPLILKTILEKTLTMSSRYDDAQRGQTIRSAVIIETVRPTHNKLIKF